MGYEKESFNPASSKGIVLKLPNDLVESSSRQGPRNRRNILLSTIQSGLKTRYIVDNGSFNEFRHVL